MPSITSLGPDTKLLLTSVGPTTEEIAEQFRNFAFVAGGSKHQDFLVVTDGWGVVRNYDQPSRLDLATQRVEAWASRRWTNTYIKVLLSGARIRFENVARLSEDQLNNALNQTDVLVLPSGNTFDLMRGLEKHCRIFRRKVSEGLPVIADSAGTIGSGSSINSALLPPADLVPSDYGRPPYFGLQLINADIVTHSEGRRGRIELSSITAAIASLALRSNETKLGEVSAYLESARQLGTRAFALTDKQALVVNGNNLEHIGQKPFIYQQQLVEPGF